MEDSAIFKHIEKLVAEEEELYAKGDLTDAEINHLHKIKTELDQYWDLFRQRRAFRNAGIDPENAELRSEKTIKNYKQ